MLLRHASLLRAQCFTFTESGDCKFGDRCRFRHGEEDPRFDASGCRDLSMEICRDFNAGRCRLGDACPRQHIDQPEQPKRERKPRGGGGGGGDGEDGGERVRKPRKPREVKKIDEVRRRPHTARANGQRFLSLSSAAPHL